jgi:hypothetical protein
MAYFNKMEYAMRTLRKSIKCKSSDSAIDNNNTLSRKPKGVVSWRDEYQDLLTLQMIPISNIYLEKFAVDMVQWFENNEEAFALTEYYQLKRIPEKTVLEWRKRCKELDNAVEYCKMVLCNRRERWSINNREKNASTLNFVMPHYSSVWKEVTEWRAKLRDQADAERFQALQNDLVKPE